MGMSMTDIADKAHLKKGIWMTMEASLRHLERLVEELRKKIEAKDAEAVESIGKQVVESGMYFVSDANSITVLDCLGQRTS
jgi:acetate kinase